MEEFGHGVSSHTTVFTQTLEAVSALLGNGSPVDLAFHQGLGQRTIRRNRDRERDPSRFLFLGELVEMANEFGVRQPAEIVGNGHQR